MHGIEPWAYLRDLLCLMPNWPKSRVLELAPAHWRRTLEGAEAQQRLAANTFRPLTLRPSPAPPSPQARRDAGENRGDAIRWTLTLIMDARAPVSPFLTEASPPDELQRADRGQADAPSAEGGAFRGVRSREPPRAGHTICHRARRARPRVARLARGACTSPLRH
jgi:hypothetical protein